MDDQLSTKPQIDEIVVAQKSGTGVLASAVLLGLDWRAGISQPHLLRSILRAERVEYSGFSLGCCDGRCLWVEGLSRASPYA
jgi:hypothetical protein